MSDEHETPQAFMQRALDLARKTRKELGTVGAGTAFDFAAASFAAASALHESILKLRERVEELERSPLVYDGPHEAGKTYRKGIFVTHGGSLWHANYTTASTPGDGPAWTLAVKRGKDAR